LILAHLFVKVSRPGDNEVTFYSLRVKLPPVTPSLTTQESGIFFLFCFAQFIAYTVKSSWNCLKKAVADLDVYGLPLQFCCK